MKKVLLLVICLVLLTGCDITITNVVNNDGKVTETVVIEEDINDIYLENQSAEEYSNDLISVYQDTLNEEGYLYSSNVSNNSISVTLTKEFSNMCDYFDNSLFVNASSNIKCQDINGNYEISGSVNYFTCEGDCMEPPVVDNATVTFDLRKKPLSSNASIINDNNYTWDFSSYSSKDFELKVQNNNNVLNNAIRNTSNQTWIIISIIVIFIIITIGFMLFIKYKKTKLKY